MINPIQTASSVPWIELPRETYRCEVEPIRKHNMKVFMIALLALLLLGIGADAAIAPLSAMGFGEKRAVKNN